MPQGSDIWSAGLITNDMATGFGLLGNPQCYRQLLMNILSVFGVPTEDTWPGVEMMPVYQECCSSASLRAASANLGITAQGHGRALLDHASPTRADLPSGLAPHLTALAVVVRGCLQLNPAARMTTSAARDAFITHATVNDSAQLESQPAADAACVSTQPLQPASASLPASATCTLYGSSSPSALDLQLQRQASSQSMTTEPRPCKRQHPVIDPDLMRVAADSDRDSRVAVAVIAAAPAVPAMPDALAAPAGYELPPPAACHEPAAAAGIETTAASHKPAAAPSQAVGLTTAVANVLSVQNAPGRCPVSNHKADIIGLLGSPGPIRLLKMGEGLRAASAGGAKRRKQDPKAAQSATATAELPEGVWAPGVQQREPRSEAHSHADVAMSEHVRDDPKEKLDCTTPVGFATTHAQVEPCQATHDEARCQHTCLANITMSMPLCLPQVIDDPWWAAPAGIPGHIWVCDKVDGSGTPRLAVFLTETETGIACARMSSKFAQETYQSVLGSAIVDIGTWEDTGSTVSKPSPSGTQAVAQGPGFLCASTASSTPFTTVDSKPTVNLKSQRPKRPKQRRQQAPADSDACCCNGNCLCRHRPPCLNKREGASSFCAACKCTLCVKQSHRNEHCITCAKTLLPPVMLRVKAMSPFLTRMIPADIEQFLALWSTVQGNLFAQVLIAWVTEPYAVEFLAHRLNPDDSPEATYQVLLEACRTIPGLTPQSLIIVMKDLSGQDVARTTGFLAAMVGVGVAEASLKGISSPGADVVPQQAGDKPDLINWANRCFVGIGLYKPVAQTQRALFVGRLWQVREASTMPNIRLRSKGARVKASLTPEHSKIIDTVALPDFTAVILQPDQPTLSCYDGLAHIGRLPQPLLQPLLVPQPI